MAETTTDTVPTLRTEEEQPHRRTTWAELLHDLIFTVIIAQLANRLLRQLDAEALVEFALLYVPIWWLWNGETHYSTRFDHEEDVVHRLLTSLQLLGLLVLAASISQGTEARSTMYALTYAAVRGLLLVEYGRAWYYVPDARPYIRHIATGFGISVLIWVGSAFVEPPYRYVLWGLAILIELTTPLVGGQELHRRFPPDVRHLPERYGLFTLLVLGQSVTGTTQGLLNSGFPTNAIGATLLGGIVIVGLWWAYFDRVDDDAVHLVSEGGPAKLYTAWLYLHLPLTVALTLVGVGLTYVIGAVGKPELPAGVQWLFTGSVVGYLLAVAGICFTSLRAGPPHIGLQLMLWVRLGVAATLLLLQITVSWSALGLLGMTAAGIVALVLTDHLSPTAPPSAERIKKTAQQRSGRFRYKRRS